MSCKVNLTARMWAGDRRSDPLASFSTTSSTSALKLNGNRHFNPNHHTVKLTETKVHRSPNIADYLTHRRRNDGTKNIASVTHLHFASNLAR